MFEKASRMKLRFTTSLGSVTAEDLWDLPLIGDEGASLDDIAKKMSKNIKQCDDESFVIQAKPNPHLEALEVKFEIVKRIITVKLADAERAQNAAVRKTEKEKLLRIIANKKDAALEDVSVDDLEKMVNDLN